MSQWYSTSAIQLSLYGVTSAVNPVANPMQRGSRCRKGWMPVRQLTSEVAPVCIEQDPIDTWMAVEDRLLRLARKYPVTVTNHDRQNELVFTNFNAVDRRSGDLALLESVKNPNFFRWQCNGQGGSLVRFVDCSGDDLVLQLTDLKTVARWVDGEELAWRVQSFLLQLRQWSGL